MRTPENLSQRHFFPAVCEPAFAPAAPPVSDDLARQPRAAGRRRGRTGPCGPSAWRRTTWLLPPVLCAPLVPLKKGITLCHYHNPANALLKINTPVNLTKSNKQPSSLKSEKRKNNVYMNMYCKTLEPFFLNVHKFTMRIFNKNLMRFKRDM